MTSDTTTTQARSATSSRATNKRSKQSATTIKTSGLRGSDSNLNQEQVTELLCQALETEKGGVKIYETAIRCAQNQELRTEWQKYLEETEHHERILTDVFEKFELDAETETPGRGVVRANGEALLQAMETALETGDANFAQIVAAECVVLGETKDHLNWELIGEVAQKFESEGGTALQAAYDEIEDQEDEHLYHTRGWARELWLESFGLPAVLPPPEEARNVRNEVDAARAKGSRQGMLRTKKGGSRARAGNTKTKRSKTKADAGKSARSRRRSR